MEFAQAEMQAHQVQRDDNHEGKHAKPEVLEHESFIGCGVHDATPYTLAPEAGSGLQGAGALQPGRDFMAPGVPFSAP